MFSNICVLGAIFFLIAPLAPGIEAGVSFPGPADVNSAGTMSTSDTYILFSSTGQGSGVGAASSITYSVVDGFVGPASSIPGDFNEDGVVGLQDFGFFAQCFGGAGNPPPPIPPGCENADLDTDGDVDVEDFRAFVGHFGC